MMDFLPHNLPHIGGAKFVKYLKNIDLVGGFWVRG